MMMKYYLYSFIGCLLFFNACISEGEGLGCPPGNNGSEVLVRVVGDYTSAQLPELNLWIERPDHGNWYRVRSYSEEEIEGKDYVRIMLPVGQTYRFVALGNAMSSSSVTAPLPQDGNDTHSGNYPSENSMVRYITNGTDGIPVDNLFMSVPVAFHHNTASTPQKIDVPIDGIVSLVRLLAKCPALKGMQANVTIFNTAGGIKFTSEQLPVHLPVKNSGIIDKDEYTLNTIIFPSIGTTSDIRILAELKDLSTNEVFSFERTNLHISPKQVYTITFDGITFNIEASDWDGNIDIDSEIN